MKRVILISAMVIVGTLLAKSETTDKTTSNNATTSESANVNVAVVSVNGKIIDKETGEALTGVLVQINGTGLSTYSDFEGSFSFNNLKPGNYTATVTFISYDKNTINIDTKVQKNIEVALSSTSYK